MSPNSKRSIQEVNPVNCVCQGWSDSYAKLLDVVILKWAGKDATATYEPIHPPDTLDKLVPPTSRPDLRDLDVGES